MTQVLVIEDNATIAEGIRRTLVHEDYSVTVAHDGLEGLKRLREAPPDLLILDLMLPKADGYRVLRESRAAGWTGAVLILSARSGEADKLRGFALGADDYVVKPFGLLELLARVDALVRRARGSTPGLHEAAAPFRIGDLELLPGERAVLRSGHRIALRPKEYDLLVALIKRQGEAASRISLLREVWGYDASVVTRTVDTHVVGLRRAIEVDPKRPRYILTVRSLGYRLNVEPRSS